MTLNLEETTSLLKGLKCAESERSRDFSEKLTMYSKAVSVV